MNDPKASVDRFFEKADAVLKQLSDGIYKTGYDAGWKAAVEEMNGKLASMLGRKKSDLAHLFIPEGESAQSPAPEPEQSDDRAAPGTVKPAILKIIREHPEGLTKKQIIEMTGIKPNSVRGTLWQLGTQDNLIRSDNGRWKPVHNNSIEDLLGSDEPKRNEPPEEQYP